MFDSFFESSSYASLFDFNSFDTSLPSISVSLVSYPDSVPKTRRIKRSWTDLVQSQFRKYISSSTDYCVKVAMVGEGVIIHFSANGRIVIDCNRTRSGAFESRNAGCVFASLDGSQSFYKTLEGNRLVTLKSDTLPLSRRNSGLEVAIMEMQKILSREGARISDWDIASIAALPNCSTKEKMFQNPVVRLISDFKRVSGICRDKHIVRESILPEIGIKFLEYSDGSDQAVFLHENSVVGFDPNTGKVSVLLEGSERIVTLEMNEIDLLIGPVRKRVEVLLELILNKNK